MSKCFCHFNGYEVKDANARRAVSEAQGDISTLNARMNAFASLPEGSTAGDAELADIRVGDDGALYDSAGESVRAQNAAVKNAMTDSVYEYNGAFYKRNKVVFESGTLDGSGVEQEYSHVMRSEFIEAPFILRSRSGWCYTVLAYTHEGEYKGYMECGDNIAPSDAVYSTRTYTDSHSKLIDRTDRKYRIRAFKYPSEPLKACDIDIFVPGYFEKLFEIKGALSNQDDIDNYMDGGIYNWDNSNVPKNSPIDIGGSLLNFVSIRGTTNRNVQVVIPITSSYMKFRIADSQGWKDWNTLTNLYPEVSNVARIIANSLKEAKTQFKTMYGTLPTISGIQSNTDPMEYYDSGTVLNGSPYSQVWTRGLDSHWNITPETLFSALANPASVMYTKYWTGNQKRQRAYYGGICSSFAAKMLNMKFPYVIDEMLNMLNEKDIDSIYEIEIGDILIQPGHVAFVSQIYTESSGCPIAIEISDQWVDGVRTVRKNFSELEKYLEDEAFTVYENPFGKPKFLGSSEFNSDVLFEYGNNTYRTEEEAVEMWFYIPSGSTVYVKKDNGEYTAVSLDAVPTKNVNGVAVYDLSGSFSGVGKYSLTTDPDAEKTCDITIVNVGGVTVADGVASFTEYRNCIPYAYSVLPLYEGEDPNGYDFWEAPEGYYARVVLNSWAEISGDSVQIQKIPASGKYMLRVFYDTGCGYKQILAPFGI